MKILKLSFSVLSIAMLAACTNTMNGVQADVENTRGWDNGKPSVIEKIYTALPTGYYGQNRNWSKMDHYDATNPTLPAADVPPPPLSVAYNESVNVYPLEGETAAPVSITEEKKSQPQPPLYAAGDMVEQIFFEHGSAAISKQDRKNVKELATSLLGTEDVFTLGVVGHASKRVNHEADPIKKKMINFRIAQKRADAVAHELNAAGVRPDWVIVTSKGDDEANPSPPDHAAEAQDRRVEVYMGNK